MGTIVMTEKPLIVVEATDPTISIMVNVLNASFNLLTPEEKKDFLDLYDPGPEHDKSLELYVSLQTELTQEEAKMVGIFQINGVKVCGYGSTEPIMMSAVYKTLSRLNHSCYPNVVWEKRASFCLEVRVCRTIEKGDELVTTYIGREKLFRTREERRNPGVLSAAARYAPRRGKS